MADITIVNGVYKPTNITGGHHPVPESTSPIPPQTSTGISLPAPQRTATLSDAALGTGGHLPAVGHVFCAKRRVKLSQKWENQRNMATFGELSKILGK